MILCAIKWIDLCVFVKTMTRLVILLLCDKFHYAPAGSYDGALKIASFLVYLVLLRIQVC